MTQPKHTKEDLIQYLLGSLSEADTERFDAWAVTDTEFTGELSAVENDLVDAFAQGELTGDTLARFKAHYLASPLRREKVEFARALQTYGESYAAQASEPVVAAAKPDRVSAGFFAWLGLITEQSLVVRWSVAAVASVLLAAGMWWIFLGGTNSTIASFVLAPPLRGHDEIATLPIAGRTTELRIQLQLESDDYPSYRVALKGDAAGTEVWSSERLTASSKGESKVLEVHIPAKLLKSQTYSLVVSGIGRDGIAELVSDYAFRTAIK